MDAKYRNSVLSQTGQEIEWKITELSPGSVMGDETRLLASPTDCAVMAGRYTFW